MQIATQHSERQSVGTGQHVEKRFFLSRITGEGSNVVNRHTKMPVFVESHLTNAAFAEFYQAAMSARVALQRAGVEMFRQLGRTFSSHRIEDFS